MKCKFLKSVALALAIATTTVSNAPLISQVQETQAASNISLKKETIMVGVGNTDKFPIKGITKKDKISYKTSDKKIAIVNPTGNIKAISPGVVTIKAIINGNKIYKCNVIVFKKNKVIQNKQYDLERNYVYNPEDICKKVADFDKYIWYSDDSSVIKISSNNKFITQNKQKAVTLRGYYNGTLANITFSVNGGLKNVDPFDLEKVSKQIKITECKELNSVNDDRTYYEITNKSYQDCWVNIAYDKIGEEKYHNEWDRLEVYVPANHNSYFCRPKDNVIRIESINRIIRQSYDDLQKEKQIIDNLTYTCEFNPVPYETIDYPDYTVKNYHLYVTIKNNTDTWLKKRWQFDFLYTDISGEKHITTGSLLYTNFKERESKKLELITDSIVDTTQPIELLYSWYH